MDDVIKIIGSQREKVIIFWRHEKAGVLPEKLTCPPKNQWLEDVFPIVNSPF